MAEGKLRVPIAKTFALSEAAKAHEFVESRQAIGRVILYRSRRASSINLRRNKSELEAVFLEGKKSISGWRPTQYGQGFCAGPGEAGADVVVTDVAVDDGALQSVADEISEMGRRSAAIQADISSKQSVSKLTRRYQCWAGLTFDECSCYVSP